jgi:hypothetical protein
MNARVFFVLASIALASPALAEEPHLARGDSSSPLHLRIDANFHYGIGGQSALGVLVNTTGYAAVWDDANATGSLDVGVMAFYANEPTALAPWLSGLDVDGAGHRFQLLATVGHSFHMLDDRSLVLGLHVYAGWNAWVSDYAVTYPNENVRGSATVTRHHFVGGGMLALAYRFSERVGIDLALGGPFPTTSSYVIGMFFVSAGVSIFVL